MRRSCAPAASVLGPLAVDIESEIFQAFPALDIKYKNKLRSLTFNLKDKSNPELKAAVIDGKIMPERLVTMQPTVSTYGCCRTVSVFRS